MTTKFMGITIVSEYIRSSLRVIRKFEDERYLAQMLIKTTTTFWKFKRVTEKWHNVARFIEGTFWNIRTQDGFPYRYEAEDAIEREIQKMKFTESSETMKARIKND